MRARDNPFRTDRIGRLAFRHPTLPIDASQMCSKNVTNLVRSLYAENDGSLDFEDEITQSACITHNGEIVNAMVKEAFQKG